LISRNYFCMALLNLLSFFFDKLVRLVVYDLFTGSNNTVEFCGVIERQVDHLEGGNFFDLFFGS